MSNNIKETFINFMSLNMKNNQHATLFRITYIQHEELGFYIEVREAMKFFSIHLEKEIKIRKYIKAQATGHQNKKKNGKTVLKSMILEILYKYLRTLWNRVDSRMKLYKFLMFQNSVNPPYL